MIESGSEDIYAGLSERDWHSLKTLVLDAAHSPAGISVPPHLRFHDAAKSLQLFVETRDAKHLDQAAKALCPLYPERAWLALAKS
ncbi:hypothetical protein HV213_32820 (plasmid) [Klebsiella sp. RHBSTW-00484]|uniref:hypothetical protein n=1 Tax=unclassified Klebsiella TaxID=2608929 RepID=UPI0015E4A20E|nr:MULTISPECIES: hypothetical protein [unclassified Klebsiella]QLO40566.1 hypothetical protein HV213_32820 [Klebsiella sp. RHBSTW-00484]QLT80102.1 hypothetical protein HV204_32930 [Klebsiella sp. RHBSTW-00464]